MPRITLTDETGSNLRMVDVSGDLTVADLQALAEVELRIPSSEQTLVHNGTKLLNASATLAGLKIGQDDIVLVQRTLSRGGGDDAQAAQIEQIRRQLLDDPSALQRVAQQSPQLAASVNNPAAFAVALKELNHAKKEAERRAREEEAFLANSDPFDMAAQQKIADAIKKENIQKNMEMAIENHPEAFGRVIMLYIDTEVNGVPVKAFVDSGAQATIMSPSCAERCKIMHLLDTRFAGVAEGVGTAKILGRVHSAQIKVGKQFLSCSFTIMEGNGVELLFGLDQLKRHLACIDLAKNCLRINDEEIPFLPEHLLPDHVREKERAAREGSVAASTAPKNTAGPTSSASSSSTPAAVRTYPEAAIKGLMDLGVSREAAISALESCGGNADMAANLLF
ncbi:hypothetical protein CcCBS67573_g01345 [Chytriomyces confervae]|uniref:DNA damage-inducible protein 1 n=1 Tax=Chytriomyces confervae TaxID=246404 RepID=A0A507FPL6_9FUNG|nr:DNA damage-inducible protein 1 [Chytriomyces hyalinus]TPX77398.1 hypothetical protein CcCBS67573_g01345 [Chytriomyces confervae]